MSARKFFRRMKLLWRRTFAEMPDLWEERYGRGKKRWNQYRTKDDITIADKKYLKGQYVPVTVFYYCYVLGFSTIKRPQPEHQFEAWGEFILKKNDPVPTDKAVRTFIEEVIAETDYKSILEMKSRRAEWRAEREPVIGLEKWQDIPKYSKVRVRVWRAANEDNPYGEKIIDETEDKPKEWKFEQKKLTTRRQSRR